MRSAVLLQKLCQTHRALVEGVDVEADGAREDDRVLRNNNNARSQRLQRYRTRVHAVDADRASLISTRRNNVTNNEDLPAPVRPMMQTFSPPRTAKLRPCRSEYISLLSFG